MLHYTFDDVNNCSPMAPSFLRMRQWSQWLWQLLRTRLKYPDHPPSKIHMSWLLALSSLVQCSSLTKHYFVFFQSRCASWSSATEYLPIYLSESTCSHLKDMPTCLHSGIQILVVDNCVVGSHLYIKNIGATMGARKWKSVAQVTAVHSMIHQGPENAYVGVRIICALLERQGLCSLQSLY